MIHAPRPIAIALGLAGLLLISAAPVHAICPLSTIRIGDVLDEQVQGPAAARHADEPFGKGDAWFVSWGDSLGYDVNHGGLGGFGQVAAFGVFQLLGVPTGTHVACRLASHVTGGMQTLSAIDGCGGSDIQDDKLLLDNVQVASHTWRTSGFGYPEPCKVVMDTRFDTPLSLVAGQSFQVSRRSSVSFGYGVVGGSSSFRATYRFIDLPPGAFVVACNGDTAAAVLAVGGGHTTGLSIEALWPNPSHGEIRASCVLPRGGTAFLRLFDAAGRVRETRVWDAPAASRRQVTLGGNLAPGAYFLHISQGSASAVRAVTIVR